MSTILLQLKVIDTSSEKSAQARGGSSKILHWSSMGLKELKIEVVEGFPDKIRLKVIFYFKWAPPLPSSALLSWDA